MTSPALLPPSGGRHRGEQPDPVQAVLAILWVLGHVAVLTALALTAQPQLGTHRDAQARAPYAAPDDVPTMGGSAA